MQPLFAALIVSLLVSQKDTRASVDSFVEELAEHRKKLLKTLAEDKMWTDPERKDALTRALQAASAFADSRFVRPLIRRTAYSPWKGRVGEMPIEMEYPVYGILLRIGTPSIGAAVEELKKAGSDKEETRLLLPLIVDIYAKGGFGKDLAIQRLELELSKTKDALERQNLENALKWLRRGREIKNLN